MFDIRPLDPIHLPAAAGLFVHAFTRLRDHAPELAPAMEDHALVSRRLEGISSRSLMAVDGERLLGYLAWWLVDNFRGAGRRGACVPEWAHGTIRERPSEVYRALYRAASSQWATDGCGVHAITVLAHDQAARDAWFWNGFGLGVVDASRPAQPLPRQVDTSLKIRRATTADAEILSALDAEHVEHYSAPPVFMARPRVDSPDDFRTFIAQPKNSVWLALDVGAPAGFMRFSGYDFDAVAVLQSDSAAFCNGAYVRPAYRGQRAGVALLDAALRHYADFGLTGCYTNFESFNPEAASFWPRFFQPVCLSLMRIPELLPR